MQHQFRKQLKSGQLLIGTMVTLDSLEVAEILAGIGFDWLFLDAEHSPLDPPGLRRVMQGAGPAMPCLVRLSASEEVPIKKALDVGAAGIIAPRVNSAEQAQQVVRFSKYAPLGIRGVGLGRAQGYGLKFQEYVQQANENVVVVVQAEHVQAVENIEAIVQVAGVDAVLIGPYDLSASLGRMGQVDHPEVVSAIAHVTDVCRKAEMPLGVFGVTAAAVKPYIERGYTLLVAGVDALLLGEAARQVLAQVKAGL